MRTEIPELKRCCCCLPLRRGLLVWVSAKIVAAILIIMKILGYMISPVAEEQKGHAFYTVTTLLVMCFSIEIIFDILFIVSAHTKNYVHLRIYYRYTLVMLMFAVVTFVGFIGAEVYLIIESPILIILIRIIAGITGFFFTQILVQLYFVILIRSELRKLKNTTQFEFVNHTTEPECKAQIVA